MLDKVFKSNNPFWQSMGTVYDVFIVNTLWLLCCIPVFTIGPATTAAYYALIQRLLGEGSAVHKDFISSFKRNFKQGTVLGLILTFIGAFLAVDIYMCRRAGTGIFSFFMFFFIAVFIFWAFVTLYAFPLLAKFDRTNRDILIWAFTLSIKNLPMTLMMLFVFVAAIWMCHIIPGLIFIMFGASMQFCATVLTSIFKPWLPKPETDAFEEEVERLMAESGMGATGTYMGKEAADSTDLSDFGMSDDEMRMYGISPEEAALLMDDTHEGENAGTEAENEH
ncbi:MAG: YesL family protein [Lachnospiraceae bacterium]|nr:YesL family protein [Lachnospiraceae bacterium]